MKFKLWPTNIKITHRKFYNKQTGKKELCIEEIKASNVHCPRCYQVLRYFFSRYDNKYKGVFCFNCGRDLRKPFTKYEKIRHWLRWIGYKTPLAEWPIGYLK